MSKYNDIGRTGPVKTILRTYIEYNIRSCSNVAISLLQLLAQPFSLKWVNHNGP